ncbi:MAG: 4-hydroxy-tetrahydrodipicolinate synthase [Ferruginibacter sp.]|nr:4-hydroxy-tetrahydrodipicolinate synthase [Ferruginibacter sp.]
MSLKQILRGTGVAVVTPFDNNNKVDFPALDKLINFIISNGVEYIVTLGTTGETPVLSKEEKKEIVLATYAAVNKRVPVVVGIGGNDSYAVLDDFSNLPLEDATAILSASPYYNKPSQEGLFKHYELLASQAPKPLILYNVPGRTGRNMDAATTLRLASEVKNIAGIKEASGDMQQCMEILKDCPADFLVVSGDDALALPQLACGMDGVISVAANALPRQFSDMVRACLSNDFATGKQLNDKLIPAYNLMFAENNPAGVKAFLTELDILQNNVRLPVVPLSGELYKKVKRYLNT